MEILKENKIVDNKEVEWKKSPKIGIFGGQNAQ